MPSEIGGKKFVTDFKAMVQREIAQALEEGRGHIRAATADLKKAIVEQSHGAARVIRQEAQHIRDGLGEYTGNNPPENELDAEKQSIKADEVVDVVDVLTDGKSDPTVLNGSGGSA